MTDRYRTGGALPVVVVLLLAVAGAGAWNYHRNLELERAADPDRRYQSYETQDVQALRDAYRSELESVRADLVRTKGQRDRRAQDTGSIAGNVEQFAETTVRSAAIREAAGDVAEREGQVEELETELELRERFGHRPTRHLKLLTNLDGLFTG